MKIAFRIGIVVVALILVYRLLYSYALISFQDDMHKHKEHNVYFFPYVVFNPLKKSELRQAIDSLVSSDFKPSYYLEDWSYFKAQASKYSYKLVSVKKEGDSHQVLTEFIISQDDRLTHYVEPPVYRTACFVIKDGKAVEFY